MKIYFLILISILCIRAQSADLTCSKNGTSIILLNGVDTRLRDLALNAKKLDRVIKNEIGLSRIDKQSKYDFLVSHNRSFGPTADFIEATANSVVSQSGGAISFRVAYVLIYRALFPGVLISSIFVDRQSLKDAFFSLFINTESQDLSDLRNKIFKELIKDSKLIIVSHSQGNFFATKALQQLEGYQEIGDDGKVYKFSNYKKIIGNLRIASPEDKEVAYSSRTILNDKDFINNFTAIRTFANPPAPNYILDVPPREFDLRTGTDSGDQVVNHGLSSTYLFRLSDYTATLNAYEDPFERQERIFENESLNELGNMTMDYLVTVAEGLESNCSETCQEVSTFQTYEAKRHINPDDSEGGLVSVEAYVAPTVTIDKDAVVCGRANVLDNAKIFDTARVEGNALITKNAVLADKAFVANEAFITDDARVGGESDVSGKTVVAGFSLVEGKSILRDEALVDGSATVTNSLISNFANVIGEAQVNTVEGIINKTWVAANAIVGGRGQVSNLGVVGGNTVMVGDTLLSGLAFAEGSVTLLGGTITSSATADMFQRLYLNNQAIVMDEATISGTPVILDNSLITGNAIVAEQTMMRGTSIVSKTAKVRGNSIVLNSVVSDTAEVSADAVVTESSYVLDNAKVRENAVVRTSKVYGNAEIYGSALLDLAQVYENGKVFETGRVIAGQVHGNATVSGSAFVFGRVNGVAQISGSTVVSTGDVVSSGNGE